MEKEKELDLQKLIEEDKLKRGKECQEEIQKILEKYRCELIVVTLIKNNTITQQIEINPL